MFTLVDAMGWAVTGLVVGWVLALGFARKLEHNLLELSARPRHRTAVKLNNRFYYIVPEGEYVRCWKEPSQ